MFQVMVKQMLNIIIANPDDYLTLVKKGFYLNDYEPKDLVELDSEYVAPTCDHPQLRKSCSRSFS